MVELSPVRALIVDDDELKVEDITDAFRLLGGLVVITAAEVFDVRDLYEVGKITADQIDVAFIDSHLGSSRGGGKEVLRYLFVKDVARSPIGKNTSGEDVIPNPDKIVTVGASSNPEWASEIGSFSDVLKKPLIVDWERPPLDLSEIVGEVRRLKIITEH